MCPAIEIEPALGVAFGLGAGHHSRAAAALTEFNDIDATCAGRSGRPVPHAIAPINPGYSTRTWSDSEAVG